MAIFDDKTLRRLHPAMEARIQKVETNVPSATMQVVKKMQRWRHFIPAKQHHPEESRFKEEGGQHFVQQQRAGNTASELGKSAPVGAELIGHD
ncbi:Uncharacterised protein [Klebsiella pneumoniae]|nr:Uncharacterised protein [Klebsiella pneumoniae]